MLRPTRFQKEFESHSEGLRERELTKTLDCSVHLVVIPAGFHLDKAPP